MTTVDVIDPSLREIDFNSPKLANVLEHIGKVRASGRVVTPVQFGDDVAWMVTGHDAVAAILMNDTELPAADFYARLAGEWWGRTIGTVHGEEHRAYRAFFMAPLLPTCMRGYAEKALRPIADELIDSFSGRQEIDFLTDYARPYPFRVITRLFGLPDSDDPLIQKLVFELNHFPWDPETAARARKAMTDYLRPIALARRNNPGDDLISYFATAEVDGQRLSETDLIDCIRFVYPAAGENTANALCLLIYSVLKDPAIYERVRREPEERVAAVEEALRITSPVSFIIRYNERPITIADTTIPAKSSIILALGGANHDASVFEDPSQFRLDRGSNRHLAFGRGAHLCAGAHLARAEMRMTLDRLLERLPGLKLVDPEAIVFYGGIMRSPPSLPLAFTTVSPGPERMEFADYHAIHKLITTYAQYADEGDVRRIAQHYARCRLINPDGSVFDVSERGPDAYFKWYSKIIRFDAETGRPRTRRMVGTVIIDDDGPLRAKAQHCIICFQATDKLPLQPIAAATLYDRFEKIDGTWWIVERREDLELIGDLSHHVFLDRVSEY